MNEPAGSSDELIVDVTWNAQDVATYARLTTAAQAAVIGQIDRKFASAASAAVGVAAGTVVFVTTSSAGWATLATFAGILAVFAGQWTYYFDMRRAGTVERLFAGDPEAYPPRKVVLKQTQLHEISQSMSWHVDLSRVHRITRKEGLLMIWISRADALAIPERCFATPEAASAFTQTLETRIRATKPALTG
ncbi:MAG: hypothetical protein ACRDBH_05095 [Bosea sp. (in: a-proteobacteria)]